MRFVMVLASVLLVLAAAAGWVAIEIGAGTVGMLAALRECDVL